MKKTLLLFLILTNTLRAQINKLDVLVKDEDAIKTHYLPKYVLDTLKLPAGSLKISGIDVLNIYVESPPVVIDSTELGKTLLAVNYTRYADIGGDNWNDVQIPSTGEIAKLSQLTNTAGSKSHVLFISRPVTKVEMSNSTNDAPTTPSTFPAAVKKRGLAIIGHDTLGQAISGFEPFKKYHLSLFIRSSFGPDIVRIMAEDTLDFKGATGNTTRSYEIPVQADENGIVHFYLTSMDKSYNHPQLSINAFYVREYNPYYPFQRDEINTSTGVVKPKIKLPTINNHDDYRRSTRLMNRDNIRHVIDVNKGWNVTFTNGETSIESMYIHDGYAAFDDDQFVWKGDTCIGVKEGYFNKGWQLSSAASKASFKFPWRIYAELWQPVKPDGLWVFDAGTFEVKGEWDDRWLTVYGMQDWGEMKVLADSIQGFGTNGWKYIPVVSHAYYQWIVIQWNKVDGNGVSGNLFCNAPVLVIPSGKYGPRVKDWPALPAYRNGKTYREHLGVNDLPDNNPDSVGKYFPDSRMYFDYERLKKGGANEKYFMAPDLFGSGASGRFDRDGKPIHKATHYLMHPLRQRKKAGVDYQIVLLQKNQRNYLQWDQSSISPYILIQDSTWNSWYPHGDSTIVKAEFSESYDLRKPIYEAFNTTKYYPVKNDSLQAKADFTYGYDSDQYLDKNALYNALKLSNPSLWIKWADPSQRQEIMTSPYTYQENGEGLFAFGSIYGHNTEIPRKDIDQYLQPGQQYQVGMGLVHSVGYENEPGKDWRRGSGHWLAQWLGMAWSVQWDGHLGLLKGKYGNYAVGLWTADSTLILNSGADIHIDGALIMAAAKWCKYYRQKRWNELEDHHHPYNGKLMALLPVMDIDVHHYTSSNGGQGSTVDIYDPTAPYSYCIAPELQNPADIQYFMKWAHYSDDVASASKKVVSEINVDPNDGTPYAIRRKDIGIVKDQYKHLSEEELELINPGEAYTWATAARSGARGADSIDLSMSTYVCAIQRRNEEWMWKNGVPQLYIFSYRDADYLGGDGGSASDINLWGMNGFVGGQFKIMGIFQKTKNPKVTRYNAMSYHHLNYFNLMRDYEPWSYTENDSVFTTTWRNTRDTLQFIKKVWRPTLHNDTTYNVKIDLHPYAYDVEQVNCYSGTYGAREEKLGNVHAVKEDVIEVDKMFRYKINLK